MPPKALVRPAAVIRPGRGLGRVRRGALAKAKAIAKAHPKAGPRAKGKAKAKAAAEEKRERRRGGDRGEDQGDKKVSEALEGGLEVEAGTVPGHQWKPGQRLVVCRGTYWEEEVTLAGVVKGVLVEEDGISLQLRLEGSQTETLVKWKGLHPTKTLRLHLCPVDCPRMSQDGLVHVSRVKLVAPDKKEGWMDNLLGVRGDGGDDIDELAKVREHARERGAGSAKDKKGRDDGDAEELSSATSSRKKRRTKKKGRKKKESKVKIVGTKELSHLFGSTALDPKPEVRRGIRKRARTAAKRRGKKVAATSSSSPETSSGSTGSDGEGGRLFGDEVRVKMLWKKYPGALTLNTLEMIQMAVVTHSGQPWDLDRSSLPPIFTQYWRMALMGRMGGAMGRESQTLSFIQDLLLQGRVAAACDVVTQRLKGLDQIASGGHFTVAQRQELVPAEAAAMTTPSEALEASKIQREEQKAKSAAARPWERRPEWGQRTEDSKGKSKGKEQKGKGKSKGESHGQAKDDKEKGRRAS